jgi:hypothetical protein
MVGPQIKYKKECEQNGISHFCLHFFIKNLQTLISGLQKLHI